GDYHGNVVHVGERDCTIQRRMQKLVEEANSPILSKEIREDMGNAAVRTAKHINYVNAGTIEFIYDLDEKKIYYMEMNTRIQVEQAVTEMVTGVDLVKMQLKVAMREEISFTQEDIKFKGHSLEFRINAENPYKNFLTSAGKSTKLIEPGGFGVRLETASYQGYTIPQYYDSMIAKLIVFGEDRRDALQVARRALNEFIIEGIDTTIPFHKNIINNEDFINNNYNTNFLEQHDIMNK